MTIQTILLAFSSVSIAVNNWKYKGTPTGHLKQCVCLGDRLLLHTHRGVLTKAGVLQFKPCHLKLLDDQVSDCNVIIFLILRRLSSRIATVLSLLSPCCPLVEQEGVGAGGWPSGPVWLVSSASHGALSALRQLSPTARSVTSHLLGCALVSAVGSCSPLTDQWLIVMSSALTCVGRLSLIHGCCQHTLHIWAPPSSDNGLTWHFVFPVWTHWVLFFLFPFAFQASLAFSEHIHVSSSCTLMIFPD